MRFGLDVAQHQLSWDEILERTRYAQDGGFDGAWVFDHFKPLYGDPSGPCLEGWTLLAALAAATERIRLGALVTGVTYRHPSVLAAEALTIDRISEGRLELGIGAAWFEQEHRELGIDYPGDEERIARLEEAIEVMRLLMTQDEASFDGEYYRLNGATYRPRPVQEPHPPIWVGGEGERLMLPLIARQADVWHAFGSVGSLARKSAIVDREAQAAGRDPASILRSSSLSISEPLDDVRRTLDALAAAGFSYLVVNWPTEGKARLDEFVEKIMLEHAA